MEATNLAMSPRDSLKPRADHKALQLNTKPNQVSIRFLSVNIQVDFLATALASENALKLKVLSLMKT